MHAYILVHFAADADLSQAHHVLNRSGIRSVDLVLGPYDAIVTCDVAATADITRPAQVVYEHHNRNG